VNASVNASVTNIVSPAMDATTTITATTMTAAANATTTAATATAMTTANAATATAMTTANTATMTAATAATMTRHFFVFVKSHESTKNQGKKTRPEDMTMRSEVEFLVKSIVGHSIEPDTLENWLVDSCISGMIGEQVIPIAASTTRTMFTNPGAIEMLMRECDKIDSTIIDEMSM
jgi:hypothetical protein